MQTNFGDFIKNGRTLTAKDAASGDTYGSGVALSGDGRVLAVGARQWEGSLTNEGGVYIYDRVGESWQERGAVLVRSGEIGGGQFGVSVALNADGTILAVGAPPVGTGGTVSVYDWNGSAWISRGLVFAADVESVDNFGYGVALNQTGTILAVGAPLWEGANTNQGGVYIFDWSGSAWAQRGSVLTASDAAANDNFGRSVALDKTGTWLLVGASNRAGGGNGRGSAYPFNWTGAAWTEYAPTNGTQDYGRYGYGVAIVGAADLYVIGWPSYTGAQSAQGAISISSYPYTAAADDPANSANFGTSVATNYDGTLIVVGAEGWTGVAGSSQGAVYTYDYYRKEFFCNLVKDNAGAAAERQFFAHERATGRLVGGGVSDAAGFLEFGVCTAQECYVVGLDDAAGLNYNALVLDQVAPV